MAKSVFPIIYKVLAGLSLVVSVLVLFTGISTLYIQSKYEIVTEKGIVYQKIPMGNMDNLATVTNYGGAFFLVFSIIAFLMAFRKTS